MSSSTTAHTPPSPDSAAVDLAVPVSSEDHAWGPAEAPLVLVEYGDYECPDCINSFPIVEQLREELGDRLRFIFRHFPLTSVHPRASIAAQSAEAAAAQGKFWPMHRLLYESRGGLDPQDLDRMAMRLNLEVYRFQADLTSRRWARKVERQAETGRASGVKGTPTFFLNGRRIRGNDYETLRQALALIDAG